MRSRRSRQAELLRLAQRQRLTSQEQIVQLLRNKGFNVTQASVSRDVRELGLVRVNGSYVPAERLGKLDAAHSHAAVHNELIVSIEPVGANLIVVKTPPGAGGTIAVDLDGLETPEIAGTVAGDDTIFVAVRSRAAQGRVLAMLKGGLGAEPAEGVARGNGDSEAKS